MMNTAPTTVYLSDYTPPAFKIEQTRLIFQLGFDSTTVKATHQVHRNFESSGPLELNFNDLRIESIAIDGHELGSTEIEKTDKLLIIHNTPDSFELTTSCKLCPQENTALEGLYRSRNLLCTQCEAEGFRRITPSIDRPDVLTRYQVRIEAPQQEFPVLLCNGNLVDQGELHDAWHYAEWEDPFPKPTYLFALVAGPLNCLEDRFTTKSGRKVSLRFYVEGNNVDKCQHAMHSLKQAMQWDEQKWNREYDLDLYNVVAVRDFNMGAMENKSLNVFNTTYVLADHTFATDFNFQLVRDIIGHEYFHNWSGNRVTLRDWFQLSLKEGFTVFREQEFSADMSSPGVRRIDAVSNLRNHQFSEDAGAMAHPVQPQSYQQIDNFYTATVYEKGAEVVRMLQTLLGHNQFRQAVDLYFEMYDGKAVTINEFVSAMESVSGHDFSQFKLWYSQAGTPVVKAEYRYLSSISVLEITLSQSCPITADGFDKKPFMIPIKTALYYEDGEQVPIDSKRSETVLILKEPQQTYRFENITRPVIPSLLRGYSAPVELQSNLTKENLAFLLNYDDDPYVRWDSGQQLFASQLHIDIAAIQSKDQLIDNTFLYERVQELIINRDIDHELLATLIALPSADYLGCQMEKIDPLSIHHARCNLRKNIAQHCREDMLNRYYECANMNHGRNTATEIRARVLRDQCLNYLGELNDSDVWSLISEQITKSQCMTDNISAYSTLIRTDHPNKSDYIEEFYQCWKHQPEVIDKWFAMQASATQPSTLDKINELTNHPSFDWKNPNNVRALIGRFCHGNPVIFHNEDGSGYAFAANWIKKLDPINSSLSSTIVRSFENWRNYRTDLAKRMQNTLHEIKEIDGLSSNALEIVNNSLKR
ncbi:MAG: aminopeptidase N [Gammaproteobacteria bacterium]|nr:aminopeptidase N [Gammaproteobacteria bacterium]